MFYIILFTLSFLCLGSFLNLVGYRLIKNYSIIWPRSFCPKCRTTLRWFDLVPLLSWITLKGHCRYCNSPITILYPLIETLTVITFWLLLIYIKPIYWFSYAIFISALIITIRSDAETMYISRYTTIYLIPVAFILSFLNLLPISFSQSFFGTVLSYLVLFIIAKIYFFLRKQQGIGEGDYELLATIGAFTGFLGSWFSLLIGSFLGTFFALLLLLKGTHLKSTPISFGPWLSLGALIYLFFGTFLQKFFFL